MDSGFHQIEPDSIHKHTNLLSPLVVELRPFPLDYRELGNRGNQPGDHVAKRQNRCTARRSRAHPCSSPAFSWNDTAVDDDGEITDY
jgi:hypothetical protein